NFAYKQILPSKQWLPLPLELFPEYKEPMPLFWMNFEILLDVGIKEFYFIIPFEFKDKVFKYFQRISQVIKEVKKGRDFDVELIDIKKERGGETGSVEKIKIYLVPSNEEGTAKVLLNLENFLHSPFIVIFGDEFYGWDREELVKEFKRFIKEGAEEIQKGKATQVISYLKNQKIISSLSLFSPKVFEIIKKENNIINLDEKIEGIKRLPIDVKYWINVNTKGDYNELLREIEKRTKQKIATKE
ncbi:MAG: hypothetical protein ACPLXS_02395, partial [Candidatus Micrarchaeales archaeon]